MIRHTADFQQALKEGRLQEAEAWLNAEKTAPSTPSHDERWADHRERELFQAYYKLQDWVSAKRVVESSVWDTSKNGRIRRLEELSGMRYDQIGS